MLDSYAAESIDMQEDYQCQISISFPIEEVMQMFCHNLTGNKTKGAITGYEERNRKYSIFTLLDSW